MIEIFAKRQLVASHLRLFKRGARATLDAHRPANHRAIVDTTIERLLQRAIAQSVAQVLREQFHRKRHPEEALRVAQGIPRLAQDFTPAQLAGRVRARTRPQSLKLPQRACAHPHTATESGDARQVSLVYENVRGFEYFY